MWRGKKKNPQAHEINLESYTDYRRNYEHHYLDKKHDFYSVVSFSLDFAKGMLSFKFNMNLKSGKTKSLQDRLITRGMQSHFI